MLIGNKYAIDLRRASLVTWLACITGLQKLGYDYQSRWTYIFGSEKFGYDHQFMEFHIKDREILCEYNEYFTISYICKHSSLPSDTNKCKASPSWVIYTSPTGSKFSDVEMINGIWTGMVFGYTTRFYQFVRSLGDNRQTDKQIISDKATPPV